MLDLRLRPLKDRAFDPLCRHVPNFITPLQVTALAFISGLCCCYCAVQQTYLLSLHFWLLNRALDCLDGALARHRGIASDFGGFLDLLGDFIIYSAIPIAVTQGRSSPDRAEEMRLVAQLELSFHCNNFVLFYIAAIVEKYARTAPETRKTKDITSVSMRPGLVEGFESGLLFTAMLIWPDQIANLSRVMQVLVAFNIIQRSWWLYKATS